MTTWSAPAAESKSATSLKASLMMLVIGDFGHGDGHSGAHSGDYGDDHGDGHCCGHGGADGDDTDSNDDHTWP